jgi:hypothetical protein
MIRNISLASIISESQQGESAARRAVPASGVADTADIQFNKKAPEKEVKQTDAGQEQLRADQERLKKQLEEKKAAMENASKETASVTDSLEQIKNTDYVNTFLKIFNLTSSIG